MKNDLSLATAQHRAVLAALEFASGNHKQARLALKVKEREYFALLDRFKIPRPRVDVRATGAPVPTDETRQYRASLNVLNTHYYAYVRASGRQAPNIVGTVPKVRALLAEFGPAAVGEPMEITRLRKQLAIVLDLEARANAARRGAA